MGFDAHQAGQYLRHRWEEDIAEDHRLEQAPKQQQQERNPRDAGLEVTPCHVPCHLEGKGEHLAPGVHPSLQGDRKSTRLNSSHLVISYAVFCLKKKKKKDI